MRICIASDGHTLRAIADLYQMPLEGLTALNPHITEPDRNIGGNAVNLPPLHRDNRERLYIPPDCEPAPATGYLDQWIPLTPLEDMERTDYDVLIVGTGAGGSAVLWRLCEQLRAKGKRIGIVDAGGLLLPTHAQNLPTINVKRYVQLFTNPKISIPIGRRIPDFPAATLLHALGGRTLFWSGVSPRMHPSVISQWPVSLQEMNAYYNIAEEIMKVSRAYTEGSALTQQLVNRLREEGYTEASGFPLAADTSPTRYGRVQSNVFFSAMNFFGYSLNLRPFDLAVNAYATKVLSQGGRVAGVEVKCPNQRSYILRAKNVVLSAGALETPQILLHSGIQGGAVGHYLTNHSFLMAHGLMNRENFPEQMGTLGVLIPQVEGQPYQIQLYGPGEYFWYSYEDQPLRKDVGVRFEGFGIVESRYENRVYLDPNHLNVNGVSEIQIDFSFSERDREIIEMTARAIERVSEIIQAPLLTENGSSDLCLMPPGQDNHVSGTCRMSENPALGATNRYGEVFGMSGLFVADNSVLPPIGAANPTLTTVALAIRTADYLTSRL
ncbi:GMC oxidoreductase [Paenibacillus harenae]|uniref:Choline dehydrogenase-like flavoprotein n=1 Tax=Paenibacillus harenae TaxID=306543 RepID=A0ABT9U4N3_PAEHA|nr:GMC family oxidoreductase [Paenibacillus harenae]MDQ0114528.1 choline dehydrogenase-like flavoprotein [Paenibacillus harenae]